MTQIFCIANGLAPALVGLLLMASTADAVSSPSVPADRVEAIIEPAAASIYTGEMLLLKVRTTLFGKTVALEELKEIPTDPLAVGDAWLASGRSALLKVPSVIVPESANILINVAHPDAKRVSIDSVRAFAFDERLWRPR